MFSKEALLQTKYDIQGSSCIHTPYIKLIIQHITQQLYMLKVILEDASFMKPFFAYNPTVPTSRTPPSDPSFSTLSYGFREQ